METQPVLTGLVNWPKAHPCFLLRYILSFMSEMVSKIEMEELLAVVNVACPFRDAMF